MLFCVHFPIFHTENVLIYINDLYKVKWTLSCGKYYISLITTIYANYISYFMSLFVTYAEWNSCPSKNFQSSKYISYLFLYFTVLKYTCYFIDTKRVEAGEKERSHSLIYSPHAHSGLTQSWFYTVEGSMYLESDQELGLKISFNLGSGCPTW